MASIPCLLFLSLLSLSILVVKCDDEEDDLFRGINQYRTSLNLTALTKNDRAECLAGEIADKFKDRPCNNTSGPNTIAGTEPRFSNYPDLLTKCHLNVTTTRGGQILPACIPELQPGLVLSNFTKSQYRRYLNDTQFSGIGIGSEDDWIVVVLTTTTSNENNSSGSGGGSNPGRRSPHNGASSLTAIIPFGFLLIFFFPC